MTDSEPERRLKELLNEIAGADLQIDAPRQMEERALKRWDASASARAARMRWKPRARGWLISGAGALAAVMLLLVVVNRSSRGPTAIVVTGAHSEAPAKPTAVEPSKPAAMFPAVAPRPIAIARSEPEKGPRRVDTLDETVSFMPLSPDAYDDLLGSFQVARVLLPREVLADLGVVLDVNRVGGPIQADVVFGEDGLARAIRLAQQDTGRSQ
jgi:hypothetical protein